MARQSATGHGFKFSAAREPVWIFEQLGAEPWGRLGTGILEALAVVALLLPSRGALCGLLTAGLMAGAVGSHLAVLGIDSLAVERTRNNASGCSFAHSAHPCQHESLRQASAFHRVGQGLH